MAHHIHILIPPDFTLRLEEHHQSFFRHPELELLPFDEKSKISSLCFQLKGDPARLSQILDKHPEYQVAEKQKNGFIIEFSGNTDFPKDMVEAFNLRRKLYYLKDQQSLLVAQRLSDTIDEDTFLAELPPLREEEQNIRLMLFPQKQN